MQKCLSALLLLISALVTQSLDAQELQIARAKTISLSTKNAVKDFMDINPEHRNYYNANDMGEFALLAEESENISPAMEASFRLKVAKLDGQINRIAVIRDIHWLTINDNLSTSKKMLSQSAKNIFCDCIIRSK